jgi:deazaflavin-dependent oxidoreductase (nitroreductase family)
LADSDQSIGEQLAEWGKVALLETRGRVTGRTVRTAVGFTDEADGSLLVAAGGRDVDWARNLQAHPRCRVTIGEQVRDCVAEELSDEAHARAVVSLILKYGTPAERLGRGPAFRLRPTGEG